MGLPPLERMPKKVFRSPSADAIFKPSQLQFQLFGEENWVSCHLPIRGFLLQNQHSKILSQKQLHRWKKYWKKVWCHFDGSRKTGLVRGEEERRIYRLLPPPPPPLGPPTHLSLPAKNLRRTEVTSWSSNIHLEKSYFYISENTQWRKDQPPTIVTSVLTTSSRNGQQYFGSKWFGLLNGCQVVLKLRGAVTDWKIVKITGGSSSSSSSLIGGFKGKGLKCMIISPRFRLISAIKF